MYLIPKSNLPVSIGSMNSLAFDFYYSNSFFAIGYTNETFVEEGNAESQFNNNQQNQLRFEKFFIEHGQF